MLSFNCGTLKEIVAPPGVALGELQFLWAAAIGVKFRLSCGTLMLHTDPRPNRKSWGQQHGARAGRKARAVLGHLGGLKCSYSLFAAGSGKTALRVGAAHPE